MVKGLQPFLTPQVNVFLNYFNRLNSGNFIPLFEPKSNFVLFS